MAVDEKNSVIFKLKQMAKTAGVRPNTRDAVSFYIKAVKKLRTPLRKSPQFRQDTSLVPRSAIRPGAVYVFQYDAKTADKLDYWNRTPITLIIARWVDEKSGLMYFDGISMAYLPIYMRYQLLVYILENTSGNINLNNVRVNIDYEAIKTSLSRFKGAYKKYLVSHIQSNLFEVKLSDLHVAMMLPLATWVGDISENSIWNRTIIKGLS